MTFWGVRGSIPTPGTATLRWGGNSSCVEVRHPGHPPLVLDCGTGARALGHKLVREPGRELDLLFSHFHMDHVFGFPFFVPIYTPDYQVRVTVPAWSDAEAREKLARFVNGVYHPTRLRELADNVTFHPVRAGRPFERAGYELLALALNHPGGSLAYRIRRGRRTLAYVTDTAPFAGPGEGIAAGLPPSSRERRLVEFLEGCDLVVYDTMYGIDEYMKKMTWGHSYPEYAVAIAKAAGAGHLVLFHHSPDDDDTDLDRRQERWERETALRVSVAREGATVSVEG